VIVNFPPGGAADQLARLSSQPLGEALGQSVVVENRAGANGMIGGEVVVKSPADGYTLFLNTAGTHGIATTLYPKLQYDAIRDFEPITNVAAAPLLFLVGAQSPHRTLGDLVAAAKAQPRHLPFGSAGMGSSGHMATEMFLTLAGIEMVHVPYKGGHLAAADLMAGLVHLVLDQIPASLPQIKAGKLKALAVTSGQRTPFTPELPTLAEQGLKGFDAANWWGILFPTGVQRAMVDKVSADLKRALGDEEVRRNLGTLAIEAVYSTPEQFGAFIQSERKLWGNLIRESKISGNQ